MLEINTLGRSTEQQRNSSPRLGVQMLAQSNMKKRRREVDPWAQKRSAVRTEAKRQKKNMASVVFSLKPDSQHVTGGSHPQMHSNYWQLQRPPTEKRISGTEQWNQSVVAGELHEFKCPPGEVNWLVAFLERDQLS